MNYYNPQILFAKNTAAAVNTLLTGLSAYYKLDEASGAAIDEAGTNNGTVTGAAHNAEGKINSGYTFNGSSIFITANQINSATNFTYSAWIKTTSAVNKGIVNVGGINGCPYFRVNANGKLGLLKVNTASIAESTGTVNSGAWVHVAVSYSSTGAWVFYINGSVSGSGTNLQTLTYSTSSYIGRSSSAVEYFNGLIDEVGVWSKVLTSTEITTLYNSGTGKSYPFT